MLTSDMRDIPGFDGYLADSIGNVYSKWGHGVRRGIQPTVQRQMKPTFARNGYLIIGVRPTGEEKFIRTGVHRLVCAAFHGKPPTPKHTTSHKNGDRTDNRAANLCWETQAENLARKQDHGTHDRGFNNSRASIDKDTFTKIWELLDSGRTPTEVGETLNLTPRFIRRVRSGDRYANMRGIV